MKMFQSFTFYLLFNRIALIISHTGRDGSLPKVEAGCSLNAITLRTRNRMTSRLSKVDSAIDDIILSYMACCNHVRVYYMAEYAKDHSPKLQVTTKVP